MQKAINCSIYRGGTSRALMLDEALLPPPGEARDRILIALIGGPDPKQIDGLGGAAVVSSKVAIIRKSNLPGIDIDYTFAQVVVGKNMVDYKANCGNISSAVGPYAIESGLVPAQDDITRVVIHNTNTRKDIVALVETPGCKVSYDGDFSISGVQGTGSKIELQFLKPGGSATGSTLPTGNARDQLKIPGLGDIDVSVVDASNLFIFVRADSLGLRGNELPDELDANTDACTQLETIRGMIAERLGYVEDYRDAFDKTPSVPKVAVVSTPSDFKTTSGAEVAAKDMDLHVYMMSMKKMHKTFALTGGMCVAAASVIPDTVVSDIVAESPRFNPKQITLAHPGGTMDVGVEAIAYVNGTVEVDSTSGFRTARFIMEGKAYYR